MHKRHMESVAIVVYSLEEIAWPDLNWKNFQHAFFLEMRIAGKRWRLALAEIGKDQSQVFLRRIAADADLLGEGFFLSRLLHALPCTVVKPAVIHAADAVPFDPARRQLSSTMSTAKCHD